MSIFKESFRNFIKQQIKIRETIISKGNNNDSRFDTHTVDLSKEGGKNITLPGGAFFTNTVSRQCVIRMSSGCDLTDFGAIDIHEGRPYEKASHIKGSGLARRYVLQGGTLAIDRETIERSDVTENSTEVNNNVDKGTSFETGVTTSTRTRNEKYKFKLGNRSGFRGASPNDFGTAYGDPTIRANPGEDYGSVPMPGIKTANIRTKSAYGSLREAKVEFTCYNQRQLEALELLYMRPGIPILLEWGWSPYINNKGKRVLDFPFIGEWWISEMSMDTINRKIIEEKVKSGGNYDAISGMCKNFSYKARTDGGYDCTTEIIAAGEIIETLKGNSITIGLKGSEETKTLSGEGLAAAEHDILYLGLFDMMQYSYATDRTTDAGGDKRSNFSMNFYQSFGPSFWDSGTDIENKLDRIKSLATGKLYAPSPTNKIGNYFGLDYNEHDEEDADVLKTFILTEDSFFKDEGEYYINSPYIRWDAFCTFLNRFVINTDGLGNPLVTFSTNTVVAEDEEKPQVSPLLMSRINVEGIPLHKKPGKVLTSIAADIAPPGALNNFTAHFPLGSVLNSSVDPSICLFPEQLSLSKNGKFNTVMYYGAMLAGFGIGAVASGGTAAGAGMVVGAELYKSWAGRTDMRSNNRNIRNIGHIYINLHRLLYIYKEQRFNSEGELNDDFNLYDFIKKLWDDISAASGNKYKFIIHNDTERPSVLRIIDANFQKDDELTPDKIHELKIQSNDTICRDFSYNSIIPNELSATIGVAMQNPDSIQDIDGATFAAMARGIQSRFHVASKKEKQKPSKDEKQASADAYNKLSQDTIDLFEGLAQYTANTMSGDNQKVDEESGEIEGQEEISQARVDLKSFYNKINKIETLHFSDGIYPNGVEYHKGYKIQVQNAPPVSSVIPLKFNAKMDGIGGITIGNVFKVDPTRLPKAYKASDIAFVCMGEQQEITAGQDWVTNIHGQLVLLPKEKGVGGGEMKNKKGSAHGGDGTGTKNGGGTLGNTDVVSDTDVDSDSNNEIISNNAVSNPADILDSIDNNELETEQEIYEREIDAEMERQAEEQSVNEEEAQAKEERVLEKYPQWKKQLALYVASYRRARVFGTTGGRWENGPNFLNGIVFLDPANNTIDVAWAFFQNAVKYAKNIRILAKGIENELLAKLKKDLPKGFETIDPVGGETAYEISGGYVINPNIENRQLVSSAEEIHAEPLKPKNEGAYNPTMKEIYSTVNAACSRAFKDAITPLSLRDSYLQKTYSKYQDENNNNWDSSQVNTTSGNYVAYYELGQWGTERKDIELYNKRNK